MNINMTFEVEFKCFRFKDIKEIRNFINYKEKELESISISITKEEAAKFLFRFQPDTFYCNSYIVCLKFDSHHILNNILLIDNKENTYFLVANFDTVINDINEGFIRIRTLEKMSSLLNFDFEDARKEDPGGFIDEFDLEEQPEQKRSED